jgi:endogenous inhibitor of DNA gyrase (YacG/DUF329 family)
MPRCPTCRGEARPRADNPAFPFCSPRCRAVDLGKWFIGAYRAPEPAEPEAPTPQDDGEREGEKH